MKKSLLKCFFAAAAFFSAGLLHADDSAASAIYAEGRELYIAGKYYDAAKKFEECRYSSGNPTVRANSLIAQIAAAGCQARRMGSKCLKDLNSPVTFR